MGHTDLSHCTAELQGIPPATSAKSRDVAPRFVETVDMPPEAVDVVAEGDVVDAELQRWHGACN